MEQICDLCSDRDHRVDIGRVNDLRAFFLFQSDLVRLQVVREGALRLIQCHAAQADAVDIRIAVKMVFIMVNTESVGQNDDNENSTDNPFHRKGGCIFFGSLVPGLRPPSLLRLFVLCFFFHTCILSPCAGIVIHRRNRILYDSCENEYAGIRNFNQHIL